MEPIVVLVLIFLMLLLLIFTKIAGDFVFLGTLAVLMVFPILKDGNICFGILSIQDALSGFSNPGLLTIAFLYVVSESLKNTGAIDWIGQILLGSPKTVRNAIFRMTLPVAGMSSFLNNTSIVSMMVPVVSDLCKKTKLSPSKLMIPMCYAATLGGICT